MELSITQVPIWLSILFIISFCTIPIYLIVNAIKQTYKNSDIEYNSAIGQKIVAFYWSYFIGVSLISLTGFFDKNTLPPRIIIFTTIPLFIFYVFFVQKTKWFKFVFEKIKLEELIYIHIFRFVGVFFFLGYFYDTLPKEFAFIGGTGDILTAIIAIPVIISIKKRVSFAKLLVWLWNIIGILDIIAVLTTAIIVSKIAIENNEQGVQQFSTFPFSLIPAFAPATIIFLHILVFKKLKEENNNF